VEHSQARSNQVKPVLLVKPAVRIVCNPMTMNNLQNKQLWSGQTMLNLVKCGQI
jgi:hypothetical protein